MTLGIYELMTIFCAALMGYIADKYDWKFLHILGWILAICGVVVMSLFPTVLMLILSGAIVGIGNNMFSESAHHALEKYDIDHAEDGAFMALSAIARESGYMVSPIVCGILYGTYGFQAALLFCATCVVLIGCLMIWQTLKLKR
jgi:MFS family permease